MVFLNKERERLSEVPVSFGKMITIALYIIDENESHHLASQNIDETCYSVNSATRHPRLWHIAVFK